MGKRGNGEGSISRRKNGGWCAQYVVYTSEGRKRRTLYGKTRKEVAAKLSKALADREVGLVFDAGTLTVGEYLDRWLSHSVRGRVRQKTYERYESIVRVHLAPALGRIRLKALTPDHVRGLYREKLDGGLAPRTVLHIHRALSKALKQATDDGLIPRNAATSVKPPQPRREELQPLSRDQVQTFLDTVKGDRMEALYVLAITAGLRQGELLALRWEDVDLEGDHPTLQVRRSLSETRGRRSFESPKSGRGASQALPAGRKRPQSAPQAPARRAHEEGWTVGGSRPHISLRGRDSHEWAQPLPGVQDPRQAGRSAADATFPRPSAHVRHAPSEAGRKPQVCPRALGPRRY
jgi:integrase